MFGTASAIETTVQPIFSARATDGKREFTRLVQASPAMMWIANLDGACIAASRTWLEFRGRSLEQELGAGWAEGVHPDDASRCLREYWGAFANRRAFRMRYRIRLANGSYTQVENTGIPWFDPSGVPGGYVGRVQVISGVEDRLRSAAHQLSSLSAREREVLELIARGYATKEAAGKLGISYKTADSHRSHVLKKLGLHETASLVRFAIRAGLIEA